MRACGYRKYYSEYIRGDLPPVTELEFYRHLQHCRSCERELDLFYRVHRQLQDRRRPAPEQELAVKYHQTLHALVRPDRKGPALRDFLHELIFTHSRILRLVEVLTVLMIGIMIGWFFFYDSTPTTSSWPAATGYSGRPISKQDMEYLNYYLLASEMVLLEMVNSDMDADGFFIERETAQKLLIKTFLVHEVALKLNDPKILKFLSRMELILYEISNAEEDQLPETLSSVRFIIAEAKMLSEVRALKQLIENSGTPALIPG